MNIHGINGGQHLVLKLFAVLGLIAVMIVTQNCSPPQQRYLGSKGSLASVEATPGGSTTTGLSANFKSISAHIFQTKCISCHSPGADAGFLNLTTYAGTFVDLIPGDSENSPLYMYIENNSMPKADDGSTAPPVPLSDQEKQVIKAWIDSGAPDDKGNMPILTGPIVLTPPQKTALQPTYQSIYSNIIYPKCVSCHQPGQNAAFYDLTYYSATMMKVVAGNSSVSPLFYWIQNNSMPKAEDGSPRPARSLSNTEKRLIRNWIDSGAPDN